MKTRVPGTSFSVHRTLQGRKRNNKNGYTEKKTHFEADAKILLKLLMMITAII